MRSRISSRLPEPWVVPARKLARVFDQIVGLPLSPWRRGIVVMFHVGRCGSTVLGTMLDQHPKIRWDGEVYHTKWAFSHFKLAPFDNKTFLRRQMRTAGRRFYGFEVTIHPDQHPAIAHRTLEDLVADLLEVGVTHCVILERRNHLRRMISQVVGTQTQVRHLGTGEKAGLTKIRLDPQGVPIGDVGGPRPLLQCFEEIERAHRQLEGLLDGKPLLNLTYEDDILAEGPNLAYRSICQFIGIDPVEVNVRHSRTNPFPIQDIVENYDELAAMLRGTEYEWMLES